MKSRKQNKCLAKPWGRSRIATAPARIRHQSVRDYNRHRLSSVSDEWRDEVDSEEVCDN